MLVFVYSGTELSISKTTRRITTEGAVQKPYKDSALKYG
jgi:hypothetical protein